MHLFTALYKEIMISKNKKRDWIGKVFCILTILMVISSAGINYTYANNHTDSYYSIPYSGDGSDIALSPRAKLDYSSVYDYNQSTHCDHWVSVGATQDAKKYSSITFKNCTQGATYVTVKKGTYKFIYNTVKEERYKYAFLVIGPSNHSACRIKGCWSPDSV